MQTLYFVELLEKSLWACARAWTSKLATKITLTNNLVI